MIVYRPSDRIPVKIGEVKFLLSPLTLQHKSAIASSITMRGGKEVHDQARMVFLSIKHSVKSVDGIKLADGSSFPLEFEESGSLTDDSTDAILSMGMNTKIANVCASLVNEIHDPKIAGVKVDLKNTVVCKKK